MLANELRQAYLKFFESKDHHILPSASLVPAGDPTILLTAAGMVPFKPYYLGTAKPEHTRVTTCQKCVRTADIENVGRTSRHGTFFEMLGNFSFGDYFKDEAIAWAWEFVTEHLGFTKEQIWITIYLDDDEAFEIWNKKISVDASRIVRKGKEDNFWEIGVGPCGPCSEIHIDRGPKYGCGKPDCGLDCDCGRFIEIWNLVFIQFHRNEDGKYSPLERKGIDTGMGLERVAAVLQDVPTIFDTDETKAIRDRVAELTKVEYGHGGLADVAVRLITDHARATTFMVCDGIVPSNEGRGYVLRRLLRRAVRYGRLVGVKEVFMPEAVDAVIRTMKVAYPELERERDRILLTVKLEEERFLSALEQGSAVLDAMVSRIVDAGGSALPGEDAFRLYDTYGFPYELTVEIAGEKGLTVDKAGFDRAMEQQREKARAARGASSYLDDRSERYHEAIGDVDTRFTGYEELRTRAKVVAMIGASGEAVGRLQAGERGEIVLDATPFYAESGGQAADTGRIVSDSGAVAQVVSVTRPLGDAVVHQVVMESGGLSVGDTVIAEVDESLRRATAANHSATHLLHAALRRVLGQHVQQAGSAVDHDRLRFDFSHHTALTPEQIEEVEDIANGWVLMNLPVNIEYGSLEEARRAGAMALFDEKYGDTVRMVKMGDVSLELCGGTHVCRTGDIGLVKIVSESSIAAGIRRIEAVSGMGALHYVRRSRNLIERLNGLLKSSEDDLLSRVERLQAELHAADKELERLRAKLAQGSIDGLVASAVDVDGVKMVTAQVEVADIDGLRSMADMVRDRIGSGIVILGAAVGGKASFVVTVTRDLTARGFNAGAIVRQAATVAGGGGGGRADMAQAGGKDVSKIKLALEAGVDAVRAHQTGVAR
ncbi:MAG: alanine--tRNA ligase [Bacillota bacterium]